MKKSKDAREDIINMYKGDSLIMADAVAKVTADYLSDPKFFDFNNENTMMFYELVLKLYDKKLFYEVIKLIVYTFSLMDKHYVGEYVSTILEGSDVVKREFVSAFIREGNIRNDYEIMMDSINGDGDDDIWLM